jgi:hypothetical protein
LVKRTDKKIVIQAIKYAAQKWQSDGMTAIRDLDYEDLDRIAWDICEAIDKYNGAELKDEQKALDAVRNEGGLMLTQSAKGQRTWSTPRGTLIAMPAARTLIERKMVKPTGAGLFGDSEPQLYEAVLR